MKERIINKIVFSIFIVSILIISLSYFASARNCENANVKVHFTYIKNQSKGNLAPQIFVGKNLILATRRRLIFYVDSSFLDQISYYCNNLFLYIYIIYTSGTIFLRWPQIYH